ncbi:MAG: ribonuclease PH [Deinococcaceae bacterium]
MRKNRLDLDLRPIEIERGHNVHAEGSAHVKLGRTHVSVTVSVDHRTPFHTKNSKKGWLTAEYSMLPRATHQRLSRETQASGGRRQEIQRLIGRSFRNCVNLALFPDKTLVIDADVLQADGSTRVASIIGAYVALFDLADRFVQKGILSEWPLLFDLGAVSVGLVDGKILLDLDFAEDSRAEADINVVATSDGKLVEVQGGTERRPLEPTLFHEMVETGLVGVQQIMAKVKEMM